jgi:hypothetical protein
MFAVLVELATKMGSSLASICQVLIVAGFIFECVKFDDTERLEQFASAARGNSLADEVADGNAWKQMLVSLSRTNSVLVSGPTRNRRHIEGAELVKVRLPPTFLRRIDLYAKLMKSSRRAILTRFFERGLLLYMRSQEALMSAVLEVMKAQKHPLPTGGLKLKQEPRDHGGD